MLRPTPHGSVMILGLLLSLLWVAPARGQQPGIELQLETTTLEPGETIVAKLICTNIDKPDTPQATVHLAGQLAGGLELNLLNETPSVFNQSSWINGRMSQSVTYTYQLQLQANEPGRYTLGPVSVKAGGKVYKTKPVTIIVRQPTSETKPRGDQFIFVELEVEPRSLYVTESFSAKLTIGIRNVIINGRRIDMDLLSIIDARRSQLSVFGSTRFSPTSASFTDAKGRKHDYTIYRATVRLRAENVGAKTIGSIFLKAAYPTEVRRSFFNYRVTRNRRETTRADAVTIEVKGPPSVNRPPSFQGAIGRYAMRVSAKPNRVEQGQPITLTITISGTPLEGVAAPDLARHPELSSRFDFSHNELLGDMEGRTKSFRLALFPKQQGEQTVPAIPWSFFNPKSETYVTLTSDPIPLTVDPPSPTSTNITLANETNPLENTERLTLLKGGISPNYVNAATVLANQAFVFSRPWSAALVVPPMFWFVVSIVARRRAKLRADGGLARRRRAERKALPLIRAALNGTDATEQWGNLAVAFAGYLADRFNLPGGTLTPDEARTLLESHRIDPRLADDLVTFLETADAVQYAQSKLDNTVVKRAARDVRKWIKRLERLR